MEIQKHTNSSLEELRRKRELENDILMFLENGKQHAIAREKLQLTNICKDIVPKMCDLCDIEGN